MKRYHEEKHIIENRAKKYRQINSSCLSYFVGEPQHEPEKGRYRKSLRCSGCGRARCQLCHPEKFPKRKPTRLEQQSKIDLIQQNDL